MTPERIQTLAAGLPTDDIPSLVAQINAAAKAAGHTRVVSRIGGIGLVMQALGPEAGGQFLDSLELMGATSSAVRWALVLVNRSDLDFGDAATRQMIDALCPPEVAAALKAIAEEPDVTNEVEVMSVLGLSYPEVSNG